MIESGVLDDRRVRTQLLKLDAYRERLLTTHKQVMAKAQAEPLERLKLLSMSILKLRQESRAVQLLTEEVLVEEILCVARTMVEVAVNALYLQDAEEDAELDRFMHFDTQSYYKHSSKLSSHLSVFGEVPPLAPAARERLDEILTFARAKTNRKDSDPTWSVRSVFQRAEIVDKKVDHPMMVDLVVRIYAFSHSHVHGSYLSLIPFAFALDSYNISLTEERMGKLIDALSHVNFVLAIFGLYAELILGFPPDGEWFEINRREAKQLDIQ